MNKYLALVTKQRLIYGAIGLIVIFGGYFLFFNKKSQEQLLTVHPADFLQQVSASGTIVAKDNLNLSFSGIDQVSAVKVAVGDKVTQGQLLASQNTSELGAQYLQMQAGVNLQKAKLAQLLAGASDQDIQTTQSSVTSAQQNLDNAYTSALTSLDSAYTTIYNSYTTAFNIQNTYFYSSDQESFAVQDNKKSINANIAHAKTYLDMAKKSSSKADIDTAVIFISKDIQGVYNSLEIIRAQCDKDTYYSRVSLIDKTSLDTQKTNVSSALTSVTSAKSSILSYATALSQAQDQLSLKKAPVRDSDIAVYQAQIEQAEASLQATAAQLNKKRIYSPIRGIVTAVNVKVGSIFGSNDTAISVISENNFQIESYVPQVNISLLSISQGANISLDAYGLDVLFPAKVVLIDPAETIKDGVSTYKVTLEFVDNTDVRIKSGMTGNIVITTLQKPNVISVPQALVVLNNDKKAVKVKEGESVVDKEVQTGSIASNGNIEITSGLKDGDVVIVTPAN